MTKSCIKRVKRDRNTERGKERDRKRNKRESKHGRILRKEKVIIRELKNCLMKNCDKSCIKNEKLFETFLDIFPPPEPAALSRFQRDSNPQSRVVSSVVYHCAASAGLANWNETKRNEA